MQKVDCQLRRTRVCDSDGQELIQDIADDFD